MCVYFVYFLCFFFFKQKTAYEMRISDWSSDVCSSDLVAKAVEANGGKVISREYTTDKANDFTSILTNIKSKAPDAIFFGGLDAQSGPMRHQMVTLEIGRASCRERGCQYV